MIFNKDTAIQTAKKLLQINAIKLNPENPFTWTSGWKSPIYCDNRKTLSYPEIRTFLKTSLATHILEKFEKPDCIAGVATGAIGIGLLVAEALDLPFVYVRPEPKKHGLKNQIEGNLQKEHTVMVIEDLISTGKSSLQAVEALRANGNKILGMAAIFNYGFKMSSDNFANAEVKLFTLSNYETLLETAVQSGYIDSDSLSALKKWNINPSEWK